MNTLDQCLDETHTCHKLQMTPYINSSVCNNTDGSYDCECLLGFRGDGYECIDIDECEGYFHNCDVNSQCTNRVGSWECRCLSGFTGNGTYCNDVDECGDYSLNVCSEHSQCANLEGKV